MTDEMDYKFYAIVDEDEAIVSVKHDKYKEVKAIFAEMQLAIDALNLQDDNSGLRIECVEVVSA